MIYSNKKYIYIHIKRLALKKVCPTLRNPKHVTGNYFILQTESPKKHETLRLSKYFSKEQKLCHIKQKLCQIKQTCEKVIVMFTVFYSEIYSLFSCFHLKGVFTITEKLEGALFTNIFHHWYQFSSPQNVLNLSDSRKTLLKI